MNSNNAEWEVRDYLTGNDYFQSYGLGGLDELARNGVIKLTRRLNWQAPFIPDDSQVLIFQARRPGQSGWNTVAVDFRDQNYMYDMTSLKACKLYFKVNYLSDYVKKLPADQQGKVRAAGLYFESSHSLALLVFALKSGNYGYERLSHSHLRGKNIFRPTR